MKVFGLFAVGLLLLFLAGLVSCSSTKPLYDMNNKGLFKVGIIIENSESWSKIRPIRLFFKKIEDTKDLTKGKIISSEVHDDNFIVLNYEPGVYSVVAVEVKENLDNVFIFFDTDTINYIQREIKAGETVDVKDVYVVESSPNFFGNVSEVQDYHREVLSKQYSGMLYVKKFASLDTSLNNIKKTEMEKKIDDQVVEKQIIEEIK